MIFMKMLLILNSFEVLCEKNPLFKIQSALCGRLAINTVQGSLACLSQLLCNSLGLLCWAFSPTMASHIRLNIIQSL